MVQFKAISKIDTSAKILEQFEQASGALKREVMSKLAEKVAYGSPVDTGNYVLSHEVVSGGRDGSFPTSPTTSHGLPRKQDKTSKQQQGLAIMLAQIQSFGDDDTQFMLRNRSEYAVAVEYGGWGEGRLTRFVGVTREEREQQAETATQPYRVYANARQHATQIILDAKAKLGFK